MRTRWILVIVAAVAAVSAVAAASRLLALRVEVAPSRATATGTVMVVTVQVAPEDRARLGSEAWLRAELLRDRTTVDRVARPVAVDADGRATTEVEWPPGSYRLRVDIESAGGESTGFWVMDLEVPVLAAAPTATALASAPAPEPEPASAPASEPASEPGSGPTSVPVPVPVLAAAPVASSPSPVAARPTGSPDQTSAVAPEEVTEAAPTAEPLAVPPPPAEEIAERPPAPASPAAVEVLPAEEMAAAGGATNWSEPAPGELEVTVAASRDGRALLGLTAADLAIRADGVVRADAVLLGGPAVPLELALVVAVSGTGGADPEEVGRALARTAARGAGALGGLTVVAGSAAEARRLSWDEAAAELPALLGTAASAATPDLPAMVAAALDGLGERGGRRFVLLVTDGRDSGSRGAWRELGQRLATAAAPLLVTGLWTPDFESRTRGRLSDVAAAAGGSAFFVQGVDRLRTALEQNGDLVTASRLVRLARPAGSTGQVAVQIEPVDPAVTVLAPPRAR